MKHDENISEKELVERAISGNKFAINRIVRYLQQPIGRIALEILGNKQDAEDITQEALIQVIKKLKLFRGESSLKTWAIRIAINFSLNEIKKKKQKLWVKIREGKDQDLILNVALPSEQENMELKEALNKAIYKLDIKYRSVVVLRLIEGYSVKETSKILDIAEGTVLSRLSRAQQKLKKDLKGLWIER
ncbi:MAG: RNA polymerase sigma factor [Hyphomicrobiales bacterium]